MADLWRRLLLWLLLGLAYLTETECARGGSRGGSYSSRGGYSYRGSYSSSYRGSSSSSYRASWPSNTYRGSRYSSRYISYVPTARYSRIYPAGRMSSYYFHYYNMYFAFIGTTAYYRRPTPAQSATVCANYEATDNGTYMGIFVCPLNFEPYEFTECCGDEYAEFCCKKTVNTVGIIFGVIAIVIVVACAIVLLHYVCTRNRRGAGKAITPPPGQGQGRSQPGQGQRRRPGQSQGHQRRTPSDVFTVNGGVTINQQQGFYPDAHGLGYPPSYPTPVEHPHPTQGSLPYPISPPQANGQPVNNASNIHDSVNSAIPPYNPPPYYPPPPQPYIPPPVTTMNGAST